MRDENVSLQPGSVAAGLRPGPEGIELPHFQTNDRSKEFDSSIGYHSRIKNFS